MTRFASLLAASLLVACSGMRSPQRADVYDLGPPPARLTDVERWSGVALETRLPYWFDSLTIEYRLLYDEPLRLRSYAASRWAASPAQMLEQRLRQQLGLSAARGRNANTCRLRIELQEFSQVFATPQRSSALLQGQATLLDTRQRIIAEKAVAVEQPASSADARGGVGAMVAASGQLGNELLPWLYEVEKRGRLKSCRVTTEQQE
ncbi:ABC-type transport auxiliary lipoprotein family protein [Accumulibacter sp.]|uniref:ABC-type transport auxiliary lipoprotein family protein n=1 Tax=Accumulibacter sp. TaxID=2053492 RepID=UPI0025D9A084|nr:ABC-type transport auxiliary lipoprotein family protein [Accumulibacter sp.]MCM8612347.1 ABC-type transport auxiliary lipoprotein family protein [Accumulibacter sp.]MCM8636336.1 ABC-type transport auxiliary lipoprotein family protein [Accumulibacter sp.]MCM8640043.1 ABC-type transport auxiliary lipoprotein family protein [Accumulibacter sp.]